MVNARLADAIDLMMAIQQAHWNIRVPSFIALHELFDRIAARFAEHGNTMAERAVRLSSPARDRSGNRGRTPRNSDSK